MRQFRSRAMMSLVLVTGIVAVAMQAYVGYFIDHDLHAVVRSLGLLGPMIVILEIVAAFVLFLALGPLARALRTIESGNSPATEERTAARVAGRRYPLIVILVAIVGFLVGPIVAVYLQSRAAGGQLDTLRLALIVAVNLAAGYGAALQAILLIDGVIRAPVARLRFLDLESGRVRRSFRGRIILAALAAAL
ncbi:MAG TPA: hypothetical protein VMC79_08045, partial [Rectinemataceae bacterium]|nr:hypothetical protein [Rectinemataceae bacterium]